MGSRIYSCIRRSQFVEYFYLRNRFTHFRNVWTASILTNYIKPDITALSNSQILPEKGISEERSFLVRLKTDPDTFGNPIETEIVSAEDIKEEKYFSEQPLPSQKLSIKQYADLIKQLISERKIKEALDLVEVRMLKEDRVKPESYIYNLLLGACGRVGYTKKGFMLYNDMKRRGLPITAGTYTALFNACANSPWPLTDGITRARKLYQIIIEKGYEPNETNYNAMIKAFGRGGDLAMAFNLVDEMRKKSMPLNISTMDFLFQACISDKDAGFRHALLVWRKLLEKNIKPTTFTYNLMLRSIRDCGLGDLQVTQDVINKLIPLETKLLENGEGDVLSLEPGQDYKSHETEATITESNENHSFNQIMTVNEKLLHTADLRPNLMAEVPHLGNIISLSEVKTPADRLLLVGGCRNYLENMKIHECQPDIKTFTQLLDMIHTTDAAESDLLSLMKKFKVRPDVDFYNMLIKRRSMRCDYKKAKEVLYIMAKRNLRPDLITFGVLAMGCKTKQECTELVETMKQSKYSLNAEILGAMLHQACYHFNFNYVLEVMELCLRENVKPNKMFMEKLSKFRNVCRDQSFKKIFSERQEGSFMIFKKRYKTWLTEVEVDELEDVHPWQQFRQETEGDSKYYKWKDSSSRFKPRHNTYYRNKLSLKEWKQDKMMKDKGMKMNKM